MYELKKLESFFTRKFFGTGPSSYKKRIYRAAVSQRLINSGLGHVVLFGFEIHLAETIPPICLFKRYG